MSLKHIKVIGFDADDTLWVNEPYFQEVEKQFRQLMKPYLANRDLLSRLFDGRSLICNF